MTLKSSVVIFQALKPLQPQWPQWPQKPQWPQWPQQLHFIKKITRPDGLIIPGTKMTNISPFLWTGSSKLQFFTNIWYLYVLEAVEASQCYFFENRFIKIKCPTLLKPLATVIQQKYWSFCPSEPFTFTRYAMRHPVWKNDDKELELVWILTLRRTLNLR